MRLTNAIRDAIVKTALERTFAAQEAAYKKARTALADAVYAHEYGGVERAAKKLPAGWLGSSSKVAIDHPDFERYYYNSDAKPSCVLEMSKPHLIPGRQDQIKIGKDHPLFAKAQDVAGLYQKLEKARDTLREKVRDLVIGHNTVDALLKTWPEGKPYLPSCAPAATGTALVPVHLAAEVNALMGLDKKPQPKK